jgi:hypothetical protein
VRKLILVALAALFAAAAAAQEPAADPADEEKAAPPSVDAARAAAVLPGLFDAAPTSDMSPADLASALEAYAGCEIVAGALLSELERLTFKPAEDASPAPPSGALTN